MQLQEFKYSKIEEARDEYFVEYIPPVHNSRFAVLMLTYLSETSSQKIASDMESEAFCWIKRFPIPVMISSFNNAGDYIDLKDARPESSLIAFINEKGQTIEKHWGILNNNELPDVALDIKKLEEIYVDVEKIDLTAIRETRKKEAIRTRAGWIIVFLWAVVLPVIVMLLEYFSPQWVSAGVLLYGLYKAGQKALKLLGVLKPTAQEETESRENQIMRHHHYYCKENPEGFLRLKAEVIDRNEKKAIEERVKFIRSKSV